MMLVCTMLPLGLAATALVGLVASACIARLGKRPPGADVVNFLVFFIAKTKELERIWSTYSMSQDLRYERYFRHHSVGACDLGRVTIGAFLIYHTLVTLFCDRVRAAASSSSAREVDTSPLADLIGVVGPRPRGYGSSVRTLAMLVGLAFLLVDVPLQHDLGLIGSNWTYSLAGLVAEIGTALVIVGAYVHRLATMVLSSTTATATIAQQHPRHPFLAFDCQLIGSVCAFIAYWLTVLSLRFETCAAMQFFIWFAAGGLMHILRADDQGQDADWATMTPSAALHSEEVRGG